MKREQINIIKKYSKHIAYAKNGVALGLTLDEAKEVYGVYNEIFKKNEKNYTCPSCRIHIFTQLDKLFEEYKESKKNAKKSIKEEVS